MNSREIIALQEKIGTNPDGFFGPKSIAACQRHLRSLMPSPNPWPTQSQAALTAFYGAPGDEHQMEMFPVPGLGIKYDGKAVTRIYCHRKVGASLVRVLTEIAAGPHRAILAKYAGVYNNRTMRGGSLPSLHARGAAIDLDPAHNGNSTHWPTRASMPIQVMEAFASEGWLPAGAFWSRDAMHFQSTR